MIQAIIIDDEQHCIDRLGYLLANYAGKTVKLKGSCKSVGDGVLAIHELRPDLVFLDIQVNGQTAFDLLSQFAGIDFEVIFTTAYEKYAVQAFKFSAIDYLLKPIDPDDLRDALGKLSVKISQIDRAKKFDVLFDNIKNTGRTSRRITVPRINGFDFLRTDEIVRCQADINYTHLFLRDRPKITVAKTLKEFEELLTDYQFYRVHNSHLVNLSFVTSYIKGKGGYIVMADRTEIEVSTRRKDGFLKRLKEI